MSLKESSDDVNPIEIPTEATIASTSAPRGTLDYAALAIATCGVGYLPVAPGTFGSIAGVGVFLLLRFLVLEFYPRFGAGRELILINPQLFFLAFELVVILLIALFGIWAASRTERLLQRKDPGKVVVDEVAGQLVALLPLPLFLIWPSRVWVIVSFILFRLFDILKPYPARQLEALPGGLGIMADDLVAGAYAAVGTAVFMAVFAMFVF